MLPADSLTAVAGLWALFIYLFMVTVCYCKSAQPECESVVLHFIKRSKHCARVYGSITWMRLEIPVLVCMWNWSRDIKNSVD